jgi:multiple sugar transport system substrate-binding protein
MFAAGLAACGTLVAGSGAVAVSAGAATTQTITFIAAQYSGLTQPYWQGLVKSFEAQNPGIKVNLEVVSWNDIGQKVDTLVANKQYPDILNDDNFSGYASEGLLYKADQIVSPAVYSDFLASFEKQNVVNGVSYALPFIASARAFFYNKTIFATVGIKAPPRTWAELLSDAQAIKAKGYIAYGLPLGSEDAEGEWTIWMLSNGGSWETSPGHWALNSPQNIQTMTFLNNLANKYQVTETNPGATDRTSGVWTLFTEGKIAMMDNGSPGTLIGMIDSTKPEVDYGVAAEPTRLASQKQQTLAVQDNLMAFKTAPAHLAADRAFLDYFYEPNNYKTFLSREGFLPTTLSGEKALGSNPEYAPFMKLLAGASFYPETDPGWTAALADAQSELGLGVEPGHSAASVLDQLQQQATQATRRAS